MGRGEKERYEKEKRGGDMREEGSEGQKTSTRGKVS